MCLDVCHLAVEFEDPATVLAGLAREGIRIGRVQISSALCVKVPENAADRDALLTRLTEFADPVYLHQVIGNSPGRELRRYRDLPEALAAIHSAAGSEWRIHFHVPVFHSGDRILASTQSVLLDVLRLMEKPFTTHLEIETYTWGILPVDLKTSPETMIEREYRWVLDRMGQSG